MGFRKSLYVIILSSLSIVVYAQALLPGFDKEEYRQLMFISARTSANPDYYKDYPEPSNFRMIYQSEPMGLDNLWDYWLHNNGVAVISIRGTSKKQESWLANFYAAMVPAKGALQLSNEDVFTYHLADHPKAAVHVGWLLSMAYLSKEIVPKIQEQYELGTKEFIIMGHSQGGAISFLMTSYLSNLQQTNQLPADIRFKTYCSASPKPGNLYYAYEYEAMTQEGWSYNVVNAADWVPEMPVSIQTLNDFNTINPFTDAKKKIKKQKFPKNLALLHVYNQLEKKPKKAQKKYEKYLGNMMAKTIQESLPDYQPPSYYPSSDYVRVGATIVLLPDEDYYTKYPDDPSKLFPHHLHKHYLYLLNNL